MKNHKQIEEIFYKTLELLIRNVETPKDFNMVRSTIEDYEDMGYSTKKFRDDYKQQIENLQCMFKE